MSWCSSLPRLQRNSVHYHENKATNPCGSHENSIFSSPFRAFSTFERGHDKQKMHIIVWKKDVNSYIMQQSQGWRYAFRFHVCPAASTETGGRPQVNRWDWLCAQDLSRSLLFFPQCCNWATDTHTHTCEALLSVMWRCNPPPPGAR